MNESERKWVKKFSFSPHLSCIQKLLPIPSGYIFQKPWQQIKKTELAQWAKDVKSSFLPGHLPSSEVICRTEEIMHHLRFSRGEDVDTTELTMIQLGYGHNVPNIFFLTTSLYNDKRGFRKSPLKSLRAAERRGNLMHQKIASLSLAMTRIGGVFQTYLRNLG